MRNGGRGAKRLSTASQSPAITLISLAGLVPEGALHYIHTAAVILLTHSTKIRIIALMLGRLRMDIDTAINHYDHLAKEVFSDMKRFGDGKFKATKLEQVLKSVVDSVTHDSESPLLVEGDQSGVCQM